LKRLDAARPDEVAAGLVAGKAGAVHECDACSATGQHERSDAARRAGPNHRNIERVRRHDRR
jgi:hypothetical protein